MKNFIQTHSRNWDAEMICDLVGVVKFYANESDSGAMAKRIMHKYGLHPLFGNNPEIRDMDSDDFLRDIEHEVPHEG